MANMKQIKLLLATMMAFMSTSEAWAWFIVDGNTYELVEGLQEVRLTKLAANSKYVTVPSSVTYNGVAYPVTTISSDIIVDCQETLKTIEFPSTLKTFYAGRQNTNGYRYESPLQGCMQLETVDLRSCHQMTEISESAFMELDGLLDVYLPPSITKIGARAFEGCERLSNIKLGYITEIGEYAFYGCFNLSSTFSLSNVKIGSYAFAACRNITTLSLNNCTMEDNAFYGSYNIVNISLENISAIPDYAFANLNNMQSITLPESLNYIGEGNFQNSIVKDIYCSGNNVIGVHPNFYPNPHGVTVHVPCGMTSKFKAMEGWQKSEFTFVEYGDMTLNVYTESSSGQITVQADEGEVWTIPATGGTLTKTLSLPEQIIMKVPKSNLEKVIFNGEVVNGSIWDDKRVFTFNKFTDVNNVYVVTSDSYISFRDNTVKELCINNWDTDGDGQLSIREAEAVTSLGDVFTSKTIRQFDELKYFTGLRTLDNNAFANCTELSKITLPQSITALGKTCFKGCNSLNSIDIPDVVQTIGFGAFDSCLTLASVHFPRGLRTIEQSAFYYCPALEAIEIPQNVTDISQYQPFSETAKVASISVSEKNTKYDSRGGCNAIIEKSTNKLLVGCKNTRIPDNVTSIGYMAFRYSSDLTSIELPAGITEIGDVAFYVCSKLSSVVAKMPDPTVVTLGSQAFHALASNCVLTVPAGTRDAYIAAGWTESIFRGGVVEAEPEDDGMLTAALVPSNGWYMELNDGISIGVYTDKSQVVEFPKGSNLVITPDNMSTSVFDTHLFVNGVETELEDGALHLQNVTEDLLIEAKYELKQLAVGICSSPGGTVKANFTRMDDVETNDITPSDGGGQLVTEIKPGTDMTFIFTPQQGYELGLVFCHDQRYIGEGTDFDVQLQADGTYQFVLPADQIVSEKTSVIAIYKKTGTDVNYDVNNDGSVTIADAVLIVDHILNE